MLLQQGTPGPVTKVPVQTVHRHQRTGTWTRYLIQQGLTFIHEFECFLSFPTVINIVTSLLFLLNHKKKAKDREGLRNTLRS